MGTPKSKNSPFSPFKQPQLDFIQKAFTNIQSQFSNFLQNLPLLSPNPSFLETHLESTLPNLQNQENFSFNSMFARPVPGSKNPVWARTAQDVSSQPKAGMSVEAIEERLAGVPVYALTNEAEEFVLVKGVQTNKSLGLFCFKEEDAEAFLEQMRMINPGMRRGSKVVAVALNKVFQLKVEGVAFRLIPESSQIKNALNERQKAGLDDEDFPGVPVFQSRSLILKSQDKRYRPVFFRKEDLENSLLRASRRQNRLNPARRQGDIQVAVLEEIIKGLQDNSTSEWEDIVFIPPGFDVSTDPTRL